MKTVMMMILGLTSMSAMASEPTLLTYTFSNGSVAPAFHKTQTCNISATTVMITSTGPTLDFPRPINKATVYTMTIPNETVLKSLINEASQHMTITHPAPIGGEMQRYIAPISKDQSLVLLVLSGNLVDAQNPSTAATELVEFMKINCTVFTIQ